MKQINFLFVGMLLVSLTFLSAGQISTQNDTAFEEAKGSVEVYYFHYTRRCPTCQSIQAVTKEAITEYYGDKVVFTELNLDEDAGKIKSKALDVSGQTLLIVSDDSKINITNEGFMYARSNPDKLKQIIKEKIDAII
jgi:hypothetical protein